MILTYCIHVFFKCLINGFTLLRNGIILSIITKALRITLCQFMLNLVISETSGDISKDSKHKRENGTSYYSTNHTKNDQEDIPFVCKGKYFQESN